MARGDTAARQIRLWMLLQESSDLSVDQAAERLGCTVRTVYRDLDGLQRAGLPLYQEQRGRKMRWRLVEGFNRRLSVQLTVHEAMALVAAERFMAAMQGSVFEVSGKQALAKLKHALAPEIRTRLEALTRHVTTTPAPLRRLTKQRPYLEKLLGALERHEVVVVEYRKLSAAAPERYTIEPHSLNVQGSAVHVVLWARERNAARVFLLDRIESVKPTGERFAPRPELGPGAFDQGAFGLWNAPSVRIVLRFKGSAARIVAEQQFHPTQQTHWNHDGTLTLELVTPPSPALRAWVRGFGKRVDVLEPKTLLEEP
ncbi:MAG: helix-turn-helix transcriptional regulator [Myxococcota bacterium]